MNEYQAGDRVVTRTGEIAEIIDPRDGHILLAHIRGMGMIHLHEANILRRAA